MFVTLFNYKFDGLLSRTSKAWLTRDDGTIAEVAAGDRRVIERGALATPWVYIEGTRANLLDDPTDLTAAGWDTPAPSSTSAEDPTGDVVTIAEIDNDGTTVRQVFDSPGTTRPAVTASVYVKSTSQDVFGVRVTNATPSGDAPTVVVPSAWRRVWRSTVPGANSHAIEMVPSINGNLVWGACLESVPAYAGPANFPSQPILETTTRTAERFSVGGITAEIAARVRSLRVEFVPDFGSADVLNGQVFNIALFVGVTTIGLWLAATGDGQVRARGGDPSAFISSDPLTFFAGQRFVLQLTLASGTLEVGPLAGGGAFSSGTHAVSASTLYVGSSAIGGQEAFGLVSPVELGFDDFFLDGIDQVTSNSIRVSFADGSGVPVDVRQFSELSAIDALNPANYIVTGSAGLPSIQYIQPGEVGSEVTLFFDARITPGSVVKVRARNLVRAGSVPIPVYDGERAAIECIEQGPGNYSGRVEVVEPGIAGQDATFEFVNWTGPGSPPGLFGVEVVDSSPAAPHVRYNFTIGEPFYQMEAAVNFVAGSLMRVVAPGSVGQFSDEDELSYSFASASSEDPITLTLLAFGAEINAATIVVDADADIGRVDIANPQTEVDAAQGASLGTYQITETGDLANEHGRAYLRKRIFRRLSTFRTGFFHLASYGLRLPSKNLFTSTTIRRLQLDIETQVRQEPGVVAVRASISELRPGIVLIALRVQDDNGSFGLEATLDFTAG